jgi:hypothetical protein
MSKFLSLFGFKSEDKIKRVKINTESSLLSDDMNIITAVKSLMNDFDSGDFNIWQTVFDQSSINLTKKLDNTNFPSVGIKISFYYRFGDEFEMSNLFLTYFYPRNYIDITSNSYSSEHTQTTLVNKELIKSEMLDFFYGIYHKECIRLNEILEKEKKLKNKVLQEVIGIANVRDSKLDDLLNNE